MKRSATGCKMLLILALSALWTHNIAWAGVPITFNYNAESHAFAEAEVIATDWDSDSQAEVAYSANGPAEATASAWAMAIEEVWDPGAGGPMPLPVEAGTETVVTVSRKWTTFGGSFPPVPLDDNDGVIALLASCRVEGWGPAFGIGGGSGIGQCSLDGTIQVGTSAALPSGTPLNMVVVDSQFISPESISLSRDWSLGISSTDPTNPLDLTVTPGTSMVYAIVPVRAGQVIDVSFDTNFGGGELEWGTIVNEGVTMVMLVPEPSSLILLVAGALGIVLRIRRRR